MSNTFNEGAPSASGSFRIGDVFNKTFGVFGRHFITFVILTAIAYIPQFLAVLFRLQPDSSSGVDAKSEWFPYLLAAIIEIVCASLASAVVIYGVVQDLRGQSFSVQDCLQRALARLVPLLGVAILVGIVTGLASLLLVIPGIIVAMMYYVSQPACIAEKLGVTESMSRSAALTKGFRWQVFAILVIFGLLSSIVIQVGTFITMWTGPVIAGLWTVALQVIQGAFNATLSGVIYSQLRTAKEGVDIEKIASVFE